MHRYCKQMKFKSVPDKYKAIQTGLTKNFEELDEIH